MKKLFLGVLLLLSLKAFPQNADTSDFFRIGIFSGDFNSANNQLKGVNNYFNSVSVEVEYVKYKNLSFYFRSIYEFTELLNYYEEYTYNNSPKTYRLINSFGVKYYLSERYLKPYLKLGINREYDYIGDYSYYQTRYPEMVTKYSKYWYYSTMINFGVGIQLKLAKNLSADLNYDIYRVMNYDHDYFLGHSVLAGLKYNIFY